MIRQFSVGGVVYRKFGSEIKFLVCKNSSTPGYIAGGEWVLPKGWIDDEEGGLKPGPKTLGKQRATPEEMQASALREVREEGGIEAKIVKRLGETKFWFVNQDREKVFKTAIFYLMEYIRDLPEGFSSETEEVRWVTANEAVELLGKKRKQEGELILLAVSV